MKFRLILIALLYSITSNSQCFECGTNIGGWTNDYIEDIDQASDGIVLTTLQRNFYEGVIYKFDNNCNLIWSYNFIDEYDFIKIHKTTLDTNDNVYSLISSDVERTVDGVIIYQGMNIIKISSDGNLLWSKKIGGQVFGAKIHYSNNHLIIHGRFQSTIDINNEITLTSNGGEDHYLAKFRTNGDLIKAVSYGQASSTEIPLGSDIDTYGNLYLTGRYENSAYLIKFDFDLVEVWNREISNRDNNGLFYPSNVFFNNLNNKVYVWGNFIGSANLLNNNYTANSDCIYGKNSILGEFDSANGNLNNATSFNNCSIQPLPSVGGNWRDDNVSNGYMASKDNELYVLTSFRRNNLEFNNGLVTSTFTGSYYNEDLILFKVNLDDFSTESVLQTEGENSFLNSDITYKDGPGPILIIENDIYLTSFFQSSPLYINNTKINNNSGNMDTDILYYKYSLDSSVTPVAITYKNTCLGDNTSFLLEGSFDTIVWNFDDPKTNGNNTSTVDNPIHQFSDEGVFNVTATVTCGTQSEILSTQITISSSPIATAQPDLYACEDSMNSGFSSNFDTSNVQNQIIGSQNNISIEYYDENKFQLSSPLPNPMTNTIQNTQQITARVFFTNNPQCFSETTFQLVVQDLPEIVTLNDFNSCDLGGGFSRFDLTTIQSQFPSNEDLEFYDSNFDLINIASLSNYENIVPNLDLVYVRLKNSNTNCYAEISVNLIVNPLPISNNNYNLIGCDDNNDGISEYFDTSKIEELVLGDQLELVASYFNEFGDQLSSPLPNPYTNTKPHQETIIIRVTNPQTACYSETSINLTTSNKPSINQPTNLYACNNGNGIATFNTSNIRDQLIGDQTGLVIYYFDENGNELPSPLPINYQNTNPWKQTIFVKVESELSPLCSSETSFEMIVNELPKINLENTYFLCDLEPSLNLASNSNFDTWKWTYEDGSVISNTFDANLIEAGTYTLQVSTIKNGIYCENSYSFNLVRSILPVISKVEIQDISDNNTIQIITSGTGDFEYSIDGINYQDDSVFYNLSGGVYNVQVRDKNGCGLDSKEVVVVGYPRIFTPNDDGYNDFWQIDGIEKFLDSKLLIYDRYGKLLKELTSNSVGWDGTVNGNPMPSNDYWFNVFLSDGRTFKGHFSLIR